MEPLSRSGSRYEDRRGVSFAQGHVHHRLPLLQPQLTPSTNLVLPPVHKLIAESDALLASSSGPLPPAYGRRQGQQKLPKLKERAAPYSLRPSDPGPSSPSRDMPPPSHTITTHSGPSTIERLGGAERTQHRRRGDGHRKHNSLISNSSSPSALLQNLSLNTTSSLHSTPRPPSSWRHYRSHSVHDQARGLPSSPLTPISPSRSYKNDHDHLLPKAREYESKDLTQLSFRRCAGQTCFYIPPLKPAPMKAFSNPEPSFVFVEGNRTTVHFRMKAATTAPDGSDLPATVVGVPLLLVEENPDCILGSREDLAEALARSQSRVTDGLSSKGKSKLQEDVKIVLNFEGNEMVTRRTSLRCECSGITRARLAFEIVQAFRHHLKITIPLSSPLQSPASPDNFRNYGLYIEALRKVRLVGVSSEDGIHWRPSMVVSNSYLPKT